MTFLTWVAICVLYGLVWALWVEVELLRDRSRWAATDLEALRRQQHRCAARKRRLK